MLSRGGAAPGAGAGERGCPGADLDAVGGCADPGAAGRSRESFPSSNSRQQLCLCPSSSTRFPACAQPFRVTSHPGPRGSSPGPPVMSSRPGSAEVLMAYVCARKRVRVCRGCTTLCLCCRRPGRTLPKGDGAEPGAAVVHRVERSKSRRPEGRGRCRADRRRSWRGAAVPRGTFTAVWQKKTPSQRRHAGGDRASPAGTVRMRRGRRG